MFLLILVVLLYVFVDFGWSFVKEPPKSTETYTRHTKINTNIQKTHQNQQKHTKDTPKSTQTCKRTTKISRNIQKTHQNQHKHTKDTPKSTQTYKRTYVFVDFGGSFVCFC
jgi:cytoskeletal protein RodZ